MKKEIVLKQKKIFDYLISLYEKSSNLFLSPNRPFLKYIKVV